MLKCSDINITSEYYNLFYFSVTKSGARQYSTEESTLVCPIQNQLEENVESEPCKSVSTARAMFENMSSSSERLKNIKAKSQLKSWYVLNYVFRETITKLSI